MNSTGPSQSDTVSPQPLNSERDEFIRTFFSKGVRLTQELLRENEQLNNQVVELKRDNALMRMQLGDNDATHDLLTKISSLESEKAHLLSEVQQVQATSAATVTSTDVEAELADLAGLYVASRQLYSTMSVSSMVRQITEILEQLVGARAYAIYFLSDSAKHLVRIAGRGLQDVDTQDRISRGDGLATVGFGEGMIGKVFATGNARVSDDSNLAQGSFANPAACIPMRIVDRVVGVIAIFNTLEQKSSFLPVDYEFFKFLSGHAACAIVSARLFADVDRQIPGIESFFEHIQQFEHGV
ncbi:MAG: GAF domain-containing protein [Polyangiaceae bacterium]|nr:GAF domain-containing protein [Polyangiaceae bacterium]